MTVGHGVEVSCAGSPRRGRWGDMEIGCERIAFLGPRPQAVSVGPFRGWGERVFLARLVAMQSGFHRGEPGGDRCECDDCGSRGGGELRGLTPPREMGRYGNGV